MSNKYARGSDLPEWPSCSLRLEIMSPNLQCFALSTDPKLFHSNKNIYQEAAYHVPCAKGTGIPQLSKSSQVGCQKEYRGLRNGSFLDAWVAQ